ncbi:MAG: hypothetical protein AAFP92_04035, partial [Bacteroidota bacterium]
MSIPLKSYRDRKISYKNTKKYLYRQFAIPYIGRVISFPSYFMQVLQKIYPLREARAALGYQGRVGLVPTREACPACSAPM